ncbi:MAG: ribosomal-processing cysteine protease Prp [Clostridia bacterium]|nr:ribosomal-processing cysteine protease Prp [Clostridia bacterium]
MTKARFFTANGEVAGFIIEGHSTDSAEDNEGRLLCAAVSSAAYMAANTVTEIIGDKADIEVKNGVMSFKVSSPSDKTKAVLKGFKLHLSELSKQYGKRLSVISEV